MGLALNITSSSTDALNSHMSSAITSLAAFVAKQRAQGVNPAGPSLEITFMLPGKLDKPDFTGMRMGGYSSSDNKLYFEKAVPDTLIHSPLARRFVSMVIEDAVLNATEFFNRDFPHQQAEAAAEKQWRPAQWSQLLENLHKAV